jgi:hypothetical protein
MTLPEAELSFYFAALAQLTPDVRPVFAERVAAILGAHPDPGPGDVDRAVRAALVGLWTPPEAFESARSRAGTVMRRHSSGSPNELFRQPAHAQPSAVFWAGTLRRNVDFIGITCAPSPL